LLLQTKDAGFQVSVAGVVEYSVSLGNDAPPVERKKKKGKKEKKCKAHPITYHEGKEEEQSYSSTLLLTSTLDCGGWLTPLPALFILCNETVPIVQEAGRAAGPVLSGAENLDHSGTRSLYSPARSGLQAPMAQERPHVQGSRKSQDTSALKYEGSTLPPEWAG